MSGPTLHLACGPGEIRVLLADRDDEPVEIVLERHPDLDPAGGLIGGIFRGRVRRLVPAAGGAFVDIGRGADGFLDDAGTLTEGAAITVQVIRPAGTDKPAGLTRRLQLAGAFLVLVPGGGGIEISRRIAAPGRERLRGLLASLLPAGHGLVVRTSAAVAADAALLSDLRHLLLRASTVRGGSSDPGPAEAGRHWPVAALERLLPLLARERPARILVDDRPVLSAFAALMAERLPDLAPPEWAPSEAAALDGALEAALDPVVPLPAGGRLVIERTLACTTIDIDGGTGTALAVNLAAAPLVARQLRLRQIGGPVVVDFVAMDGTRPRETVRSALAEAAAADPAGLQVLGWTRLGHLELIRPRRAVPLDDLVQAGPVAARRPSGDAAERQALATALAGLAAYAAAPPLTRLLLPAAAAALLARTGGAVLADLEARRGEPAAIEPADLPPGRFDLRPFRRDDASPICRP